MVLTLLRSVILLRGVLTFASAISMNKLGESGPIVCKKCCVEHSCIKRKGSFDFESMKGLSLTNECRKEGNIHPLWVMEGCWVGKAWYDTDYHIEWKYHVSADKTQISPVNQVAGREKETGMEDKMPNSINPPLFFLWHKCNWVHPENTERMLQVEQKYLCNWKLKELNFYAFRVHVAPNHRREDVIFPL